MPGWSSLWWAGPTLNAQLLLWQHIWDLLILFIGWNRTLLTCTSCELEPSGCHCFQAAVFNNFISGEVYYFLSSFVILAFLIDERFLHPSCIVNITNYLSSFVSGTNNPPCFNVEIHCLGLRIKYREKSVVSGSFQQFSVWSPLRYWGFPAYSFPTLSCAQEHLMVWMASVGSRSICLLVVFSQRVLIGCRRNAARAKGIFLLLSLSLLNCHKLASSLDSCHGSHGKTICISWLSQTLCTMRQSGHLH